MNSQTFRGVYLLSADHRQRQTASLPQKQKGAVLLVGMVFLIILTLIALSAITTTSQDERMARNVRDHDIAFKAAEAAMDDARKYVNATATGLTGVLPTCDDPDHIGLCMPADSGSDQVWDQYLSDSNTANSVEISAGNKLPAAPLPGGVRQQPRFVVEVFKDPDVLKPPFKYIYRTSVIGFGALSGTRVFLQEVFRPKN